MSPTSVAQFLANQLASAGVKHMYGLPGGEMLDLLEAVRKAGIEFVLTHHEAAAAFMAAEEGRFMRSPSACIATLGPGATNLVTGVAHAYLDRCPLIAITADLSTNFREDHTHQKLDLASLFAPITKGSFVIAAETAAAVVVEAIDLATCEPFGPVSLHVPRDVTLQEVAYSEHKHRSVSSAPGGDLTITQVAERLGKAKWPLVVVGLGAPPESSDAIRNFIKVYGAPVGVTPKVKGIVDERDPLFTGTYGGMMGEGLLSKFMDGRDLVLCLGLDPTEVDIDWPHSERLVWMLPSLNVTRTDFPPNTWHGDLVNGLQQLNELINGRTANNGNEDAGKIRRAVLAQLEGAIPENPGGISPLRVLQTLSEVWPASQPVCCDVGAHKLLIGQAWPSSIPNRFFMSNGLSSMGYGIAAPIALSLATGSAPVLSVIGDGGLLMFAGEMETAVRLKARVLYVVFCDSSLSLIESSQRRRGYPLYGMRFDLPDLVKFADSFGMPTWQADNQAEIAQAVNDFERMEGPGFVAVPIDPREYDKQVG